MTEEKFAKNQLAKLIENISTLRMSYMIIHLGCSLVIKDWIFESVHSE